MPPYLTHHQPGVHPGLNACPGLGERGHGLTMALVHDGTCCAEWEAGETAHPDRAAQWDTIARRRGTTWPKPAAGPEPGTAAEAEAG